MFSTFTRLLVDRDFQLNLKVILKSWNLFNRCIRLVRVSGLKMSGFQQSQALLVLPFFTTLPEELLGELQSCLDTLVVSHFPIQSDEFAQGSLHRNNYMDCIRKVSASCVVALSDLNQRVISHRHKSFPVTCKCIFLTSSCWTPWSSRRAPCCSDSWLGSCVGRGGTSWRNTFRTLSRELLKGLKRRLEVFSFTGCS